MVFYLLLRWFKPYARSINFGFLKSNPFCTFLLFLPPLFPFSLLSLMYVSKYGFERILKNNLNACIAFLVRSVSFLVFNIGYNFIYMCGELIFSFFAHECIGERHKYNCLDSFCILWLLMYVANWTFTSYLHFVPCLYLPWAFEGNIYKDMKIFVKGSIPVYCSSHFGEALR